MMGNEEKARLLIEGLRAGDRAAFSELLSMYRPLVIAQVSRFSKTGPVWEELFQDATLALYRAALCYRVEEGVSFGAYARTCVANALVSAYRKARSASVFSLDEVLPFMEAEGEDPLGRVIAAEETGDLYRAALACLSDYELRVFLLYIRGLAPRQIAPELGHTEKSVSNAIGRMLKKLRANLN